MSMVLLGITIVMALGKQTLVGKLRASARHINRVSGALLVLAGLFIIWFWGTEIAAGATAVGRSGAFEFVDSLSATALNFVADHTEPVAGSFAALVAGAALFAWRSRSTRDGRDDDHGQDGDRTRARRA